MVHTNKRYLMYDDGEPFFYLGDTAWEMFHRLSRSEMEYYLSVRAEQGFTAVQAVALAEFEGLSKPNAYGCVPLKKTKGAYDPAAPDDDGPYSYWQHVDYGVQVAAEKDLFISLLPTWGDKYNKKWGEGPEIFTPENAYIYGKWLGDRYKDQWNIIWMLGGDRPLDTEEHHAIMDAMAKGLGDGDGHAHLMTFHPMGCTSSVDYVKNRDYIAFHTVQSGHGLECYDSFKLLRRTGAAEEKPFMDAEPRYEDHPACANVKLQYLWNDEDVRQNLYWNLMEGACGNTYGNHSIWSFQTHPQPYWPYHWHEAIRHPGAGQVKYARQLRLSRPYFEFRSAPELVKDDTAAMAHQSAGRGERYAFIYSPLGLPIRAYLQHMGTHALKASWFNPRTGEESLFAVVPPKETLFAPPSSGKGCDWVLILDKID